MMLYCTVAVTLVLLKNEDYIQLQRMMQINVFYYIKQLSFSKLFCFHDWILWYDITMHYRVIMMTL
jgi:hypothetical protein